MLGKIIIVRRDGKEGSNYPVETLHTYIGRDINCDMRIANPLISPQHCLITAQESKPATIRNLSLRQPTLVNDKEIGTGDFKLKDRDIITVGHRKFIWSSTNLSPTTSLSRQGMKRKSEPVRKPLVAVVVPNRRSLGSNGRHDTFSSPPQKMRRLIYNRETSSTKREIVEKRVEIITTTRVTDITKRKIRTPNIVKSTKSAEKRFQISNNIKRSAIPVRSQFPNSALKKSAVIFNKQPSSTTKSKSSEGTKRISFAYPLETPEKTPLFQRKFTPQRTPGILTTPTNFHELKSKFSKTPNSLQNYGSTPSVKVLSNRSEKLSSQKKTCVTTTSGSVRSSKRPYVCTPKSLKKPIAKFSKHSPILEGSDPFISSEETNYLHSADKSLLYANRKSGKPLSVSPKSSEKYVKRKYSANTSLAKDHSNDVCVSNRKTTETNYVSSLNISNISSVGKTKKTQEGICVTPNNLKKSSHSGSAKVSTIRSLNLSGISLLEEDPGTAQNISGNTVQNIKHSFSDAEQPFADISVPPNETPQNNSELITSKRYSSSSTISKTSLNFSESSLLQVSRGKSFNLKLSNKISKGVKNSEMELSKPWNRSRKSGKFTPNVSDRSSLNIAQKISGRRSQQSFNKSMQAENAAIGLSDNSANSRKTSQKTTDTINMVLPLTNFENPSMNLPNFASDTVFEKHTDGLGMQQRKPGRPSKKSRQSTGDGQASGAIDLDSDLAFNVSRSTVPTPSSSKELKTSNSVIVSPNRSRRSSSVKSVHDNKSNVISGLEYTVNSSGVSGGILDLSEKRSDASFTNLSKGKPGKPSKKRMNSSRSLNNSRPHSTANLSQKLSKGSVGSPKAILKDDSDISSKTPINTTDISKLSLGSAGSSETDFSIILSENEINQLYSSSNKRSMGKHSDLSSNQDSSLNLCNRSAQSLEHSKAASALANTSKKSFMAVNMATPYPLTSSTPKINISKKSSGVKKSLVLNSKNKNSTWKKSSFASPSVASSNTSNLRVKKNRELNSLKNTLETSVFGKSLKESLLFSPEHPVNIRKNTHSVRLSNSTAIKSSISLGGNTTSPVLNFQNESQNFGQNKKSVLEPSTNVSLSTINKSRELNSLRKLQESSVFGKSLKDSLFSPGAHMTTNRSIRSNDNSSSKTSISGRGKKRPLSPIISPKTNDYQLLKKKSILSGESSEEIATPKINTIGSRELNSLRGLFDSSVFGKSLKETLLSPDLQQSRRKTVPTVSTGKSKAKKTPPIIQSTNLDVSKQKNSFLGDTSTGIISPSRMKQSKELKSLKNLLESSEFGKSIKKSLFSPEPEVNIRKSKLSDKKENDRRARSSQISNQDQSNLLLTSSSKKRPHLSKSYQQSKTSSPSKNSISLESTLNDSSSKTFVSVDTSCLSTPLQFSTPQVNQTPLLKNKKSNLITPLNNSKENKYRMNNSQSSYSIKSKQGTNLKEVSNASQTTPKKLSWRKPLETSSIYVEAPTTPQSPFSSFSINNSVASSSKQEVSKAKSSYLKENEFDLESPPKSNAKIKRSREMKSLNELLHSSTFGKSLSGFMSPKVAQTETRRLRGSKSLIINSESSKVLDKRNKSKSLPTGKILQSQILPNKRSLKKTTLSVPKYLKKSKATQILKSNPKRLSKETYDEAAETNQDTLDQNLVSGKVSALRNDSVSTTPNVTEDSNFTSVPNNRPSTTKSARSSAKKEVNVVEGEMKTPQSSKIPPPEKVSTRSKSNKSKIDSPVTTPKSVLRKGIRKVVTEKKKVSTVNRSLKRQLDALCLEKSKLAARKLKAEPPKVLDKKKVAALLLCHKKNVSPRKTPVKLFLSDVSKQKQTDLLKQKTPVKSLKKISDLPKLQDNKAVAIAKVQFADSDVHSSSLVDTFDIAHKKTTGKPKKKSVSDVESTPEPSTVYQEVKEDSQSPEDDLLNALDLSRKSSIVLKSNERPVRRLRSSQKNISAQFGNIKKLFCATPQPDYSNVSHVKKVFFQSPAADYSNVSTLKRNLEISPQADYRNVSGVKKILQVSPEPDYTNVSGIKTAFSVSPIPDYTNVTHMNRVFTTSPVVDYTNVQGVKKLFTVSPKSGYTNTTGLKELFATDRSSYLDVKGVMELFKESDDKSPSTSQGQGKTTEGKHGRKRRNLIQSDQNKGPSKTEPPPEKKMKSSESEKVISSGIEPKSSDEGKVIIKVGRKGVIRKMALGDKLIEKESSVSEFENKLLPDRTEPETHEKQNAEPALRVTRSRLGTTTNKVKQNVSVGAKLPFDDKIILTKEKLVTKTNKRGRPKKPAQDVISKQSKSKNANSKTGTKSNYLSKEETNENIKGSLSSSESVKVQNIAVSSPVLLRSRAAKPRGGSKGNKVTTKEQAKPNLNMRKTRSRKSAKGGIIDSTVNPKRESKSKASKTRVAQSDKKVGAAPGKQQNRPNDKKQGAKAEKPKITKAKTGPKAGSKQISSKSDLSKPELAESKSLNKQKVADDKKRKSSTPVRKKLTKKAKLASPVAKTQESLEKGAVKKSVKQPKLESKPKSKKIEKEDIKLPKTATKIQIAKATKAQNFKTKVESPKDLKNEVEKKISSDDSIVSKIAKGKKPVTQTKKGLDNRLGAKDAAVPVKKVPRTSEVKRIPKVVPALNARLTRGLNKNKKLKKKSTSSTGSTKKRRRKVLT